MTTKVEEIEKSGAAGDSERDRPTKDIVLVAVYTTSGAYPRQGHEKVKATELVAKFLREAAKALHLTDVTGWVATVDNREIAPDKSFAQNGLTGTVALQWGPREGGGG